MTQPAFQVDGLNVEPGSAGTRLISRDATTGGLLFTDPANTSGVLLSDLVGLQSLPNLTVVGTTYSTIQAAINGATGSPATVIIPTGSYTENLVITKNVVLVGLGAVQITNANSSPTIQITEGASSVPESVKLQGLTVTQTFAGGVCVLVDGSNTAATGTVTVASVLAVGDQLVIGGTALTGVGGARVSGANTFNASLGTTTALASEIALAINDPLNGFFSSVLATASSSMITLKAKTLGAGGNAITLTSATTPSGNLPVSGATLTGGGGLNSRVAYDEVLIQDCQLRATGVGTQQVSVNIANHVRVVGGTWAGSSSTSESFAHQTAKFSLSDVAWVNDLESSYDTGDDSPLDTLSAFELINCGRINNIVVDFIGAGSSKLANLPIVGNMTHNGDRSFYASGCSFSTLLIEDTVQARLVNCTRAVLAGTGTPTVSESSFVVSSTLAGATTDTVTFPRPQPNTQFAVLVDVPTTGVVANVTTKGTTSFSVVFSAAVTGIVYYTVLRQM